MCCILSMLLVVLNILVLLFGIGLITVSLLLTKLFGEEIQLILTTELQLPTWLIVAGVVIGLIGFLGSCGVIMKNKWMLYLYSTIVFILVAGQVALVIIAYSFTSILTEAAEAAMTDFFGFYYKTDPILSNATNILQQEFECCGVIGYQDWYQKIGDLDTPKESVPPSCCRDDLMVDKCAFNNPESNIATIYTEGCYTKIINEIEPFLEYILYGCIGLIVIQVLCIIQACVSAVRIGRKKNNKMY